MRLKAETGRHTGTVRRAPRTRCCRLAKAERADGEASQACMARSVPAARYFVFLSTCSQIIHAANPQRLTDLALWPSQRPAQEGPAHLLWVFIVHNSSEPGRSPVQALPQLCDAPVAGLQVHLGHGHAWQKWRWWCLDEHRISTTHYDVHGVV